MQATIHTIETFDVALGTTIDFTWNGNQIYKVRCVIKENESGKTVYDNTIDIMKQQYVIPKNSGLINGTYYIAYITVFDINGEESDVQNIGMPFYCFSTPSFELSIKDGDTINTSSYTMELTYSQKENEELNSYQITLYSYQKTEIQSSGTLYDTNDMSVIFTELENAKQYYIRAIGTTLHGMILDTGYILFTVAYTQSHIFSALELNNMPEIGAIEIRTNIVSIEGVPKNPNVIYLPNGGVDLRNNEVVFNDGFEIEGDFTQIYKIRSPKVNSRIVLLKNKNNSSYVEIYYREGSYTSSNGKKGYFELQATTGGIKYVVMSEYFTIMNSTKEVALYVLRKGNYYELHTVVMDIVN